MSEPVPRPRPYPQRPGFQVDGWSAGIGHGLIHLTGSLQTWGIAEFQALGGSATLPFDGITAPILALLWIGAMIVLLVAGMGSFTGRSWWPRWALAGAIVTQLGVAMWRGDAALGTLPNILISTAAIWVDRVDPLLDPEFL